MLRSSVSLLGSELGLVFRRLRTLVLLVVLACVPAAIGIAVWVRSGGGGPAFANQLTNNGLFLVFTGLVVTLPFFLPLTVGVVAGDSVAGEANRGTLRYLLVAPAGRTRLLLVKFGGVMAYCFAATFVVAATGLVVGAALFPLGKVTLLSGDTIGLGAALLRALIIAVVVALSLVGLAAIGLFVSTLTGTPIAAMAATVGAAIAVQIVDTIPQLAVLHPWLFSHYWMSFAGLLRQPIFTGDIVHNLLLQAGYLAVFGAAAWARFTSRDIAV
ncbi:MAG: ABC transporter permease [Streptosporangiaceae bacterium]